MPDSDEDDVDRSNFQAENQGNLRGFEPAQITMNRNKFKKSDMMFLSSEIESRPSEAGPGFTPIDARKSTKSIGILESRESDATSRTFSEDSQA